MSALHNWIIDAERYRILLSRHLSPSYFNLCHPSLSPSTHSSLQTQNAITGFISIFRLLFLICEHSVISFLKKALYHTLYHTFFSFYSAQALFIKLWLDQILHSMTLRKGKNEKTAYSSAVTAHSGYSITVCWWGSLCERFPIKKNGDHFERNHWVGTLLVWGWYCSQDCMEAALTLSWWPSISNCNFKWS